MVNRKSWRSRSPAAVARFWWLVFLNGLPRNTSYDLVLMPLQRGAQPRPLLADPKNQERNGELSPDGRWLAYQSNESGRFEVYVRPFPNTDAGRWQISSDGGEYPLWARSGRELFYVTSGDRLVSVPLQGGSGFSHGSGEELFDVAPYLRFDTVGRLFDISPDAQRFLMTRSVANGSAARLSIIIVSNWFEELKAKVAVK
jgi:eukaryotic-like serine/threonine-protein kinase